MCSLTFVPQARRYLVAMNRDENPGREVARPPLVHRAEGEVWVGPEEASSGGTWIATNGRGITLALLNVHPMQPAETGRDWRSRGLLIPKLVTAINPKALDASLLAIRLSEFKPFQLIAIFPDERAVLAHRWDGARLEVEQHHWSLRQEFSSGVSDSIATQTRSGTAHVFPRREGEDERVWARRLHSSHLPERGAFSYCVHRPDARTVSYTEVVVEEDVISMQYHNGSPCEFRAELGFDDSTHLDRRGSTAAGLS